MLLRFRQASLPASTVFHEAVSLLTTRSNYTENSLFLFKDFENSTVKLFEL